MNNHNIFRKETQSKNKYTPDKLRLDTNEIQKKLFR
jgi:hypothetical protein